MVVIRLARGGAKKAPFYRIVAADKRSPRDGRYIEQLGYYNPVARGPATFLKLDKEAFDSWVSKGAQPSERVQHLIKISAKANSTDITALDMGRNKKSKKPVAVAPVADAAEAAGKLEETAEAPAAEEAKAEDKPADKAE